MSILQVLLTTCDQPGCARSFTTREAGHADPFLSMEELGYQQKYSKRLGWYGDGYKQFCPEHLPPRGQQGKAKP